MSRLNFKKLFAALAALLLAAAPAFALEAFVINDYRVEVSVGADRVHHVSEVIDLTFSQPRHGIVRTIPLSSSEENYLIKNLSVEGESFSVSQEGEELSVKIGSGDITVSGPHTYKISYDMIFAADSYEDFDLVYISPIGTSWDAYIENADITVKLPTEEIYGLRATYGPYGSTRTLENYTVSGGTVALSHSGLSPYEGVSLWIEAPEGTFRNAPSSLSGGVGIFVTFLAVLGAALALRSAFRWFKRGRDERAVPVVEFYPPDDLSPAELEYVIKRSVSNQAVASMIFYWASKGFIRYEEKGKNNFSLVKLKELTGRPSYEKDCFNGLFGLGSDAVVSKKEIENGFYKYVDNIRLGAEAALEGRMDDNESRRRSIILMLLNFIPCAALTAVGVIMKSEFFPALGIAAQAFTYFIVRQFFQTGHKSGGKKAFLAVVTVLIAAAEITVLAPVTELLPYAGIGVCAAIVGTGIVGEIFAALTIKSSDYGVKLVGRCLGFADFLEKAEKDRIERLVDENPSYYFDILPYAVVLGV
ncbi:MAG: DUF2207 domain-containing protein, partial [Clostridia bacterium]